MAKLTHWIRRALRGVGFRCDGDMRSVFLVGGEGVGLCVDFVTCFERRRRGNWA